MFRHKPTPAPPPDKAYVRQFDGQTVVEVLYSPSDCERAIITRDELGVYRIRIEFWDTSDWERVGEAFWWHRFSGSLTDSFETAQQLAREYLSHANSNATGNA